MKSARLYLERLGITVALVLSVLNGLRLIDRIQVGLFTPEGRLARRLGRFEGLDPLAERLVALQLELNRAKSGWQWASAIHSAASIAEEVACRAAGHRTKTLDDAVKRLKQRGTISEGLEDRLSRVYINRHRTRGAGHGVGFLDAPTGRGLMTEAIDTIEALVDACEGTAMRKTGSWITSWSPVLRAGWF